jgi:hypothetical protein
MAAALLLDPLWDLVEPFCRFPHDAAVWSAARLGSGCLTGIVSVLRTVIPWQTLPQNSGAGPA